MIFVTDAVGKATYIGPEWEIMTGQSPSEAVNFGWVTVLHPENREIVRGIVLDAIRQQSEFNVRYRLRLQTGASVWIAAGAVPSFGPPGRSFLGFLGSITQIADATANGLKAYGSLGRVSPDALISAQKPVSLLEMAADHLIMAHSLLSQDGGRSALSTLETTLHHVGVALAKAAQDGRDTTPLH